MTSYLLRLECSRCREPHDPRIRQTVCRACGSALRSVYDLDRLRQEHPSPPWEGRPPGLWRYEELLPLDHPSEAVRLGETESPILTLDPPGGSPALRVLMKDDGVLPTGSFKARGMALAVSRARTLGLRSLFVPSAGNAGVALSAYGARAGVRVHVYLPESTPASVGRRCEEFGAEVTTVPGTIADAGRVARSREPPESFDVSTLREPYRWQGKKTMGLELFDQFRHDPAPPRRSSTRTGGRHRARRSLERL
ncbi:threonine synthase [mine drainage metagenome]|uniref:Threonine synthase n=1 Tax=mine drainage metagenome TaxID=410659 RepID=T1CX14_9ZZZZ